MAIFDYVAYTRSIKRVRVTRSARRHKIGVAHIRAAMQHAGEPTLEGDALIFIGMDDRGIELRIIAVPDDRFDDSVAVIHAMPTSYQEK